MVTRYGLITGKLAWCRNEESHKPHFLDGGPEAVICPGYGLYKGDILDYGKDGLPARVAYTPPPASAVAELLRKAME